METLEELQDLSKENATLLGNCNKRITKGQDKVKQLAEEIHILDTVNSFFTKTVESKVTDTKHQIEDIINTGLRFIFEGEITLRLDTLERRGRTEFILNVLNGEVEGLRETHGGGVLAVISFLFKTVIAVVFEHKRFLIYDETLTFVSKEYQEKVSEFISTMCKDMNFDIALISHQPLLNTYADIVYKATKSEKGYTNFVKHS